MQQTPSLGQTSLPTQKARTGALNPDSRPAVCSRAFAGVLLLLFSLVSQAEEARLAVASNFTGAMEDLAAAFEQQSGHQLKLSFGSSGKFYAQIKQGAPFDVFFSADQAKPAKLEQEGAIVEGSRFTYAIGALALWSTDPERVDDEGRVLRQGGFNRLALANPRLAPYGSAAVEVLRNLDLENKTRSRWVQGENIAQTYQFVRTANAELGFVALSQLRSQLGGQLGARAQPQGSTWIIPPHLYSPIRQDAVLLKRGANNAAAKAFLQFLRTPAAARIIETYGYTVDVDADASQS